MSTKILCPKCRDQNTSCPACGGSGARPFAGVTVRTGQTAKLAARKSRAPRSIVSLDYNPICASMGGHLSFHGAAAS